MIREARPEEMDAVFALRRAVFVGEQGVPEDEEMDDEDATATHLVAVVGDEVVGTCRLLPGRTGRLRLGRMAVAPHARGAGLAGAMLDEAAGRALAGGFHTIVLHAQVQAQGLYERAGYVARGDVFMDAGIEHRTMELRLA